MKLVNKIAGVAVDLNDTCFSKCMEGYLKWINFVECRSRSPSMLSKYQSVVICTGRHGTVRV